MHHSKQKRHYTTIAAIMLKPCAKASIHDLAEQFLTSKVAERAGTRSVTWDCEDLVFLDFDEIRIALQSISATAEAPGFICLGVGLVPGRKNLRELDWSSLAQSLVKRLSIQIAAQAILWNEQQGDLDAEHMDSFQDELARMMDYLDMQIRDLEPPARSAPEVNDQITPVSPRPCSSADEMERLREALLQTGQAAPLKEASAEMRAALYVTSCTLLFLVPAVGSMLFSYVALRDGFGVPALAS